MCLLMLWLLMQIAIWCIVVVTDVKGDDTQCYNASSCESDTYFLHNGDMQCWGYQSCQNATILTENGTIECHGSNSCSNATEIRGNSIQCYGLSSCNNANSIKSDDVQCYGEQACTNTVINVINSEPVTLTAFLVLEINLVQIRL